MQASDYLAGATIAVAIAKCGVAGSVPLDRKPSAKEKFFAEYASNWPGLMAASFIMSVPVVVMFLVLQKYFVRALTEGAVKA